jgi:hypothetical protein
MHDYLAAMHFLDDELLKSEHAQSQQSQLSGTHNSTIEKHAVKRELIVLHA